MMTKSENDTKNISTVRRLPPSKIGLLAKYFHFVRTVHGKIRNMESHVMCQNALRTILWSYVSLNNKLMRLKIKEYLVGAYFTCVTTLIQKRDFRPFTS